MIQSSGFPVSDRTRTLHLSQTDRPVHCNRCDYPSIAGITYISTTAGYGAIVPRLFYFPILYTAYFYPGRGIYVATCSAAAYLVIAVPFSLPDTALLGGICIQALLFIGIAAGQDIS